MRKNLLWILLITSLILCVFSVNMNVKESSAVVKPFIMIDPDETWDVGLTPGNNYTVSIKTNYTGSDIWSYDFTLYYNPNVLHGGIKYTDTFYGDGSKNFWYLTYIDILEESETVTVDGVPQTRGDAPGEEDYAMAYGVGLILFTVAPAVDAEVIVTYLYDGLVNGKLIVGENAQFWAGDFNNTLGELSLTGAFYEYSAHPANTTTGPGTLANVTFTVVGYGFSDIIIGDQTVLTGYSYPPAVFYPIIDAETMPDQILHGLFSNIAPRHDVAVTSLIVPATAAVEQPVPISVTVANEGTYDESVTLTVKNDSAVIDTRVFTLEKGLSKTESFSWDTSGLSAGSYDISATATIASDDEPGDNSDTQSVTLSMVHDVAVTSLVVPTPGEIGDIISINVTVSNEGSYDESVTLTVYNETDIIDSTGFALAKGPTSQLSSFGWDTSGVAEGTYTINATATIVATDADPGDNSDTKTIYLSPPTLEGDVDLDGDVDADDLIIFRDAYGSTFGDDNWNGGCDFNHDNKIDASDLFVISRNFGKSV